MTQAQHIAHVICNSVHLGNRINIMRQNLVKIHAASATIALILISTFFLSSLVVEIIGEKSLILTVKTYIFYAIWILLPVMAIAGATGNKLAPNAGWDYALVDF